MHPRWPFAGRFKWCHPCAGRHSAERSRATWFCTSVGVLRHSANVESGKWQATCSWMKSQPDNKSNCDNFIGKSLLIFLLLIQQDLMCSLLQKVPLHVQVIPYGTESKGSRRCLNLRDLRVFCRNCFSDIAVKSRE